MEELKKQREGLYCPELEHDNCGMGFLANYNGHKSNEIITGAISMLENMEHRGATGAEPETGDGAGIQFQVPYEFFEAEALASGVKLPAPGKYGVVTLFLPKDQRGREDTISQLKQIAAEREFNIVFRRKIPTDNSKIGLSARQTEPDMYHYFLVPKEPLEDSMVLERKLYVFKNQATHFIAKSHPDFYIASCSAFKVVYKGQLRTDQLRFYYTDLRDKRLTSAFAMIHSRFSTNTFPKWKLAQPFRFLAHNGEINTIRGNVNKMKSKQALMESSLFTKEEMRWLLPICDSADSDSANLDAMVELLVLSGRSIQHAMTMLIPEAWQNNPLMDEDRKAFYKFHASMMEPWDGPAAVCFTDGLRIGATLDRNGLRPARYTVTSDGLIILASEVGVYPVDPSKIISNGRLQPGKMVMVDLVQKKVMFDEEIKQKIFDKQPYSEWIKGNRTKLRLLPEPKELHPSFEDDQLKTRQLAFGYSNEDVRTILKPMVEDGKEPLGSMGTDTPIAVLSNQPQHLSFYFKQLFAQVSNPPIDPIRERLVMSLFTRVGTSKNILAETPEHCRQIHISQPVLDKSNFEKLLQWDHKHYNYKIINILFNADGKAGRLEEGINEICKEAEKAIAEGSNILVLSDRNLSKNRAAIPSLLALGAVQNHLVKNKIRTKASLIVECGDALEVHHFATLVGFGASAIYPYMALDTIAELVKSEKLDKPLSFQEANAKFIKAIGDGILKVMSKMGISTLQSYQGAQIFEILGLSSAVVNKCFYGTISRIEGLGFDGIARETLAKHKLAFTESNQAKRLPEGGIYQWKRRGEVHLFNPDTIHLLQKSTKLKSYDLYKKYAEKINKQEEKAITLRSLLEFKAGKAIPIEEVEPKEEIFKRFATGAMSFGSISFEAHTTLAIAMNRIGGKSNSGEGGEDPIRYERKPNGDYMRSAIKQVASGRFGVSSYYLSNADELQIKVAQGAKPGEGGQLPGHKVDEWIGRVRNSTPGVGLISPPPHHDIYSIEDLAQLIHDLKNANREARINVKLVSEAGVGTVAAGVAKAFSDAILISGYDGGTGASPISSIRHAGLPWELGLAEAHQTLVKNRLRSRVVLQTDGQLRTGRDIAIATMLGAEEWGVSTAALITMGCIMMRKCHLNTCPVGVATQNPDLRALFTGNPEEVIALFTYMAEELREIMASLGFRTINEMVGRADMLQVKDKLPGWKAATIDLSPVLKYAEPAQGETAYNSIAQKHKLNEALDWKLLKIAQPSLDTGQFSSGKLKIVNINRSVGALISNEISKKYNEEGLPEGTIRINFRGSAGQSFGAFGASGLKFVLEGEANDYFGKGLSGSQLIVFPDRRTQFVHDQQIIIGNVALYGAITGEAYINGMAGERFAVRNSGANAVVEGVGDHGCEYMTGGRVVILGPTGKNFAAGMSGGIAYVYSPGEEFEQLCNMEMVLFDSIDHQDVSTIKTLVTNHVKFTGSKKAEMILSEWDRHIGKFIKVMPKEYKEVLANANKRRIRQAV
ncbi:glutamate synthase large subunit [uncultured Imperialibacter sp.]|uniref:glutamate synthase large subunit n=1 Tax=uncultured Imperialibacter sp. TaxID=1672639 RepID=UPI0030D7FAF7|tara:strand:- start:18023 stop:22537 length:4515 start_codon:yes stop_codon:yes gene_type:complete